MRAVICRAFGPYTDLKVEEVAAPIPKGGEILLDVHAAGVNFMDALMVEGKYQVKPPIPFSPGAEVAGVVRALGPDAAGPPPGTRVLATAFHGGYAEQVAVPADQAFAIPDSLSDAAAAGMSIVYGTSFHALKDRARLQAGETLLVLGAAGGVGLTAVELGKQFGAKVIAAASTDEKLALCRQYGADEVVNYQREDLRDRIKALTGGAGVDVVYDPVGGPYTEPMIRSLAPGGRFLVVGFATGDIPKIPLNLLLLKQAAAVGVFWGGWARVNPGENAQNMHAVLDWCAAGWLRPHVSATVPLDQFREALRQVVERQATGKVVISMR